MLRFANSHRKIVPLLALLLTFLIFGTVSAAEFAEGEIYRLKADETVGDDLYVFGREIVIDGTVEGDVVAFGGYIEINGVVTGDLIGAGAGIVVNGEVQDDVRAAGSGITIAGSVGDDVIIAGGGGLPGMPIRIGNRSIASGIRTTQGAQIGGDLIVAGDRGAISGQVADDLFAGMNSLDFNAQVGGDSQLYVRTLTIGSAAQVDGTLRYSTASDLSVSNDVAANVTTVPWTQTDEVDEPRTGVDWARQFGWWLARTILIALGLALAGWMLLNFAPTMLETPAAILAIKPAESGILGIIAAVLAIPTAAALIFLGGIFWGPFPGALATAAFVFGALGLLWLFSPLVTGLWLGRKLLAALDREAGTLATMLIGALTIVVVGRLFALVPCAGELAYRLLYLVSFAFALGAGLLALFARPTETVPVEEATATAVMLQEPTQPEAASARVEDDAGQADDQEGDDQEGDDQEGDDQETDDQEGTA